MCQYSSLITGVTVKQNISLSPCLSPTHHYHLIPSLYISSTTTLSPPLYISSALPPYPLSVHLICTTTLSRPLFISSTSFLPLCLLNPRTFLIQISSPYLCPNIPSSLLSWVPEMRPFCYLGIRHVSKIHFPIQALALIPVLRGLFLSE